MSKNMGSHIEVSFAPQAPKKRVDFIIGHRLSLVGSSQLEKQMIRFYLKGMSDTNVGDDLIDEIFTDFYFSFAAGCLDLRAICEWPSITDVQVAGRHVDILDKKGQRLDVS